jgi:hypothetical protein
VIGLKNKKNKTKLNDETLRLEGIDLADDVELSTYIDARERYDYLQSKYDRIVADNYEKNKYNDKSKK